jgi:hypothetical protein
MPASQRVHDRAILDALDAMERSLKGRLAQIYRVWCDMRGLLHAHPVVAYSPVAERRRR